MKKLITSDDEKKINELVKTGKKPREISVLLNLNYNSVNYYVVKNRERLNHKYTDEEIAYLKDNYNKMSVKELSVKLKIPVGSIYNKARWLRLARFK